MSAAGNRFYIVSEMHGKVLDICGEKPQPGAELIVYAKKSGYHPNQLWYTDGNGVIRSVLNDMVMDSGVDGSRIKMWKDQRQDRQQWRFKGKAIVNSANECLDICEESRADGAAVIPYRYKGSPNQHWRIEKAPY